MGCRMSKRTGKKAKNKYLVDLKAFKPDILEANSFMSVMADGMKFTSLRSLEELVFYLVKTDMEVAKLILPNMKDIWNIPELLNLFEEYMENNFLALNFCLALETCLREVNENQLIIQTALHHIRPEAEHYKNTLEELRDFKNPFCHHFFQLLEHVCRQRAQMLEKLIAKHGFMGRWKKYKGKNKVEQKHLGTSVVITDLDDVRILVDRLEMTIISALRSLELGLKRKDDLPLVVEDFRKKLHSFSGVIDSVSEQVCRCRHDIEQNRELVAEKFLAVMNP